MLEQKDLDMIRQVVKEEINSRAIETEKFLLDEIERRHKHLEEQMKKVQKNLEDLDSYYRITKLENDNTSLLLKMVDSLSKRVEELEKRTA